MKINLTIAVTLLLLFISGCSLIQKPVQVSEGDFQKTPAPVSGVEEASLQATVTPHSVEQPGLLPVKPTGHAYASVPKQALPITMVVAIAKSAQKNPQTVRKYSGDTLMGKAKFIKAPKGNPNAVVADVRVTGLGEVSLWCRNVLGAAPAGKVVSFEGVLTGSVYTSEDFSHDVIMKDCRFRE